MDKETITISLKDSTHAHIGVNCLICDEFIRLTDREIYLMSHGRLVVRVCDKCKDAVKRIRNEDMIKTLTDPDYGTVKVRY